MEHEELEQYDLVGDEKLIKRTEKKYSQLIGLFLIKFSCLEHEINIAIADFFSERTHWFGYVIVERLLMQNKIQLFQKMYSNRASIINNDNLLIKKLSDELFEINVFRNKVVHANWFSLDCENTVRTRIHVEEDGNVLFKRTKITTPEIRKKIKAIDILIKKIDRYKDKVLTY